MKLNLRTDFVQTALMMVLLAAPFSAAQQPANSQAPPDANAPQTTSPQPERSPGVAPSNDNQAEPQSHEEQTAPERHEPSSPNEKAPAPQQQSPVEQPHPGSQSTSPAATGQTKPTTSGPKTAHKRKPKPLGAVASKSRSVHHRNNSVATPSGEPGKVVVRNGGAKDDVIRLSPGGTQEQELHSRENTAQLLATTDDNLKRIARPLTPAEQSTVDQIHSYVRQAKLATDAGDLARARTLAFKAHLLSDDLAKH